MSADRDAIGAVTITATWMSVRRVGLGQRLIPYAEALRLQRDLHGEVVAGFAAPTVLLVEHEPVYTAGTRTQESDRPQDGSAVVDTDRGGRITWHGPGQLVVYPIVRLPQPFDVVAHVRWLEEIAIGACARVGVPAVRIPGRSGAWIEAGDSAPPRKIAAVGVRVSRGVTMHGLAINADCDLAEFARIVPCGITDAGVTSLSAQANRRIGVLELADIVERLLTARSEWGPS